MLGMDEKSVQKTLVGQYSEKHEHNNKFQNTLSLKKEELSEQNINDNLHLDEILSEFLSTLMARNYKSALHYCKLILLYEPDNEIIQDFYPLIQEKMHLDNYGSDQCDENESSTKSESSTEYFSSTSVGTENMSSSSLSEEDEGSVN